MGKGPFFSLFSVGRAKKHTLQKRSNDLRRTWNAKGYKIEILQRESEVLDVVPITTVARNTTPRSKING